MHFLISIMAIHCKATTCAMDEEEAKQSAIAKIIIYSLKDNLQSVNSPPPERCKLLVYMAN